MNIWTELFFSDPLAWLSLHMKWRFSSDLVGQTSCTHHSLYCIWKPKSKVKESQLIGTVRYKVALFTSDSTFCSQTYWNNRGARHSIFRYFHTSVREPQRYDYEIVAEVTLISPITRQFRCRWPEVSGIRLGHDLADQERREAHGISAFGNKHRED